MFAFAGSRPVPRRRRDSREQRAHFGEGPRGADDQRSDSKPEDAGGALVGPYHRCRAGAHVRVPHICTTTLSSNLEQRVEFGIGHGQRTRDFRCLGSASRIAQRGPQHPSLTKATRFPITFLCFAKPGAL